MGKAQLEGIDAEAVAAATHSGGKHRVVIALGTEDQAGWLGWGGSSWRYTEIHLDFALRQWACAGGSAAETA